MQVAVDGYRDLMSALARAERDTRLGVRQELREFARPVASTWTQVALAEIPSMPKSPQWAGARIGVTRHEVYIVPRRKGTRGRGPRRRPNLGDLFEQRVKARTIARHEHEMEQRYERLTDRIADRFNHGA